MTFQIKHVYDPAVAADGIRILVDRLWPRGLRKTDAHWTQWMKDVAPSPDLRRWFGHETERFPEFSTRYRKELRGNVTVDELRKLGRRQQVTLLYAAHDPKINHAAVLLSVLRGKTRNLPKP